MKDKYVYPYSSTEAKRLGELDQWRASHKMNIECAEALDKAIRDGFDGMHLQGDIAENACREYGIDRVKWVLANTVQQGEHDGRYRPHNKEWAKETFIPRNKEQDNTTDYILKSHPEIVNGLVDQYRRYYDSLNLFDKSHCKVGSSDMDYNGQLLVLKPSILKDECKTPEDQLFYANVGGFGCTPGSHGKVMGEFLSDGEKTNFHRDDFIGIIKEECIPQWGAEKTAKLQESDNMLRVVMIEPNKAPYETKINSNLEGLQEAVGGMIEFTYPFYDEDSTVIMSNEESKLNGMEGNRKVFGELYAGPMVIMGDNGSGETISLTDEQVEKYLKLFEKIEHYTPEEVEDSIYFNISPM